MDRGYLSLLLEGDCPLSHRFDQNAGVYSPLSEMYAYVASPAEDMKPEPYNFDLRQLPDLRSLEQLYHGGDLAVPAAKRVKRSPERRDLEKQRRQNLSEKFRCLQKLLPCDRKMDTATMLEEAHKYVRFLQAQVSALHSMPLVDHTAQASTNADVYGGGLGRLSRQQLLEVVVNSHVAQTVLYSRGWCVYSTEQLAVLQRIVAHRNALAQFLSYQQF